MKIDLLSAQQYPAAHLNMASENSFATFSESELREILNNKDAEKTKDIVKYTLTILDSYYAEKGINVTFEPKSPQQLWSILCAFYAEVHLENKELYTKGLLITLRYGLQHHFQQTLGIDSCSDGSRLQSSKWNCLKMCYINSNWTVEPWEGLFFRRRSRGESTIKSQSWPEVKILSLNPVNSSAVLLHWQILAFLFDNMMAYDQKRFNGNGAEDPSSTRGGYCSGGAEQEPPPPPPRVSAVGIASVPRSTEFASDHFGSSGASFVRCGTAESLLYMKVRWWRPLTLIFICFADCLLLSSYSFQHCSNPTISSNPDWRSRQYLRSRTFC